jgi:hypothetical protein
MQLASLTNEGLGQACRWPVMVRAELCRYARTLRICPQEHVARVAAVGVAPTAIDVHALGNFAVEASQTMRFRQSHG